MAVWIQDRFTIEQDGLTLQDAIVLPQAEYNALTPQQITNLKQERFDNYKNVIKNPPPQPEQTPEEIVASLDNDLESLRQTAEALLVQKINLKQDSGIALTVDEINASQALNIDVIEVSPMETPIKIGGK